MNPSDDTAAATELEHLRERNKKLAEDKSYYQLILRLMELLNPLPGLDDMLRSMLTSIVECIGGTNIKLYYRIGPDLHFLDFLGNRRRLEAVDDPVVAQVEADHQFVEQRGEADDALLMHGMLRGSYTWTFPLLVGQELVGVIKLENLHVHGAALGRYLPIFCSHAALILSNEVRNVIRRRAEEDLRLATERLRLATEAGLIGIWDWDVEGDQLTWDDSMYRLYGRQPGEFGGVYEAWIAAVHPEDKAAVDGAIRAALRGECEYAPEFRVVWPDGSVHHIKAASKTLRDAEGRPQRMVGINYDLTERKRAETAQRRLSRELRAISACNQALIRAVDEPSLLREICRIICQVAGHRMAWVAFAEQDAARGVRPMAWGGYEEGYLKDAGVTWADSERGRGPTGTAIRTGTTQVIDDVATDPRLGPWREAALTRGYRSIIALPLPDAERRTIGTLTICSGESGAFASAEIHLLEDLAADLAFGIAALRDRDRRLTAEDEVRELNRKLEQRVDERTAQLQSANKELEAFAYSVSHDLRAPLRAIDGFSQILTEEHASDLDEDGKRMLGMVRANAQRMGRLIDDILNFSRTSRTQISVAAVDMTALAREVIDEVRAAASERRIAVRLGELPPATVDRAMIRQVFVNLLANAVKYTAPRAEAVIEISAAAVAEGTVYRVADNGVGFDMNYVHRLFGVFQRLVGAEEFEGTGIGLAIVKRIIERHGGRVWAEGKPGEGASFYFMLPNQDRAATN